MRLTPASIHDNRASKEEIALNFQCAVVYRDSAYNDESATPQMWKDYRLKLEPIQKHAKRQRDLVFDQILKNSALSRIRQPVQSFFQWLIEQTDIQNTSKCRSSKAVLLHIFSKIAAATLIINS